MGNAREKELAILLKAKADVDAAFDRLKDQLEGAEDVAKKTAETASKSWEDSMTKIRNVSAVAFVAVAGSIGLAIREAAAGEQGMANFRASVRNAGGDADGLSAKLNDTAMKLQRLTGIADDEYIDAAARMTDITGDASASIDKLGLVADLAVARKIPLASASDAVARAMEGEIGALARIMPGLDEQVRALGENADKADVVAVIFDRMAQYEGRAGDAADTTTGSFNKLKQEIAATVENGGNPFLVMARDIADDLTGVVRGVGDWTAEHQDLTKAIGLGALGVSGFLVITTGVALIIPKVVEGVKALNVVMTTLSKNPAYLAIGAAALATYGFITYLGDAATTSAQTATELKALSEELGVSVESLNAMRNQAYYAAGGLEDKFNKAWEETVAALRAGKAPLDDVAHGLKTTGGNAKKAAEDIHLNIDAIRELMNAGLDFEEARARSQANPNSSFVAQLPVQEISPPDIGFMGPIEDPVTIARYEFEVEKAKEAADKKKELLEQERQAFMQHTQFLQSTYAFAVQSIGNTEMTGKQRREAIWAAFKSNAISQIAQITGKYIFDELAKSAAAVKGLVSTAAANTIATAADRANAKIVQTGWMQAAYAKFLAFYAFAGPAAPALAGAQVMQGLAAMQAINVAGFQHGGIVPGSGFGDRVPAMLESGEGILTRQAMQKNPGAMEAMNSGKQVGGGNNVSVTLNLDGEGISLQRKIEIRDFIEEIIPAAIERALDDRRFSVSYRT